MYTMDSLLDFHERTHRNLKDLLAHCASLDAGQFDLEMEGFAYPSVRLQLHHMIGAEHYWIGVLQGRIQVEEDDAYPDLASLAEWRTMVYGQTRLYLQSASPQGLNGPRSMVTWGGKEQILVPSCVILRTQTHHYTHLGQILAMVRQMGHPARGLDFPLA